MNPFKKAEPDDYSKLLQDIDLAIKTQEISSSMATADLEQAILAAKAFTNILGDIPTERRIQVSLQYKIDIY